MFDVRVYKGRYSTTEETVKSFRWKWRAKKYCQWLNTNDETLRARGLESWVSRKY